MGTQCDEVRRRVPGCDPAGGDALIRVLSSDSESQQIRYIHEPKIVSRNSSATKHRLRPVIRILNHCKKGAPSGAPTKHIATAKKHIHHIPYIQHLYHNALIKYLHHYPVTNITVRHLYHYLVAVSAVSLSVVYHMPYHYNYMTL